MTAPADHDFGAVDPGTGVYTHSGNVNVRSNVGYDLVVNGSGDTAVITDSGLVAGSYAKAPSAAGFDHAETWEFDSGDATSDWVDPGLVSATFVYTATPTP